MNKKQKIGLISATAVLAVGIVGASSLALFTARTDSDFQAKAGTVDIELDKLDMTNPLNINPGDNDPNNPEGAVNGTEHVFSYEVANTGNKSVRTRHTIILNVDKAGASEEALDARYLALFIKDKEIADKAYVLEDGREVTSLDNVTGAVAAVKYIFISDIMDGKGTALETGGDAEKEELTDVIKADASGDVEKTYTYDFSLLRDADNKYQAADIHFSVVIEAMQYRNTNESDWTEVSRVVRDYSTANVESNVVPASDENKDGDKIER